MQPGGVDRLHQAAPHVCIKGDAPGEKKPPVAGAAGGFVR